MKRKRPWRELQELCYVIHDLLYVVDDRAAALKRVIRLKSVLADLPANNDSILRAEGFSLYYDLCDDVSAAISHRKHEIELMEQLYNDIDAQCYTTEVTRALLSGRDRDDLHERHRILRSLEKRADQRGQESLFR